jgi:hypothetical protein
MTRSDKTNRIEAKVKMWLKRNDPQYIQKMKDNNKLDSTKQKRNLMSKKRRVGHSATHVIFKKFSPLTDKEGNIYTWLDKYKKLVRNDHEVVRRARDGTIHYLPYESEKELDDERFDEPIISDIDKKLADNIEKLFNGDDEELDKKMRSRKIVVKQDLSEQDCYWRQLSETEKRKLIKKLRCKSIKGNKSI